MIKEWLITNRDDIFSDKNHTIIRGNGFNFYCFEPLVETFTLHRKKRETYYLLIEGFVLPRRDYKGPHAGLSAGELVIRLYREHGEDFIRYVKGNFVILLVNPDGEFLLFTDHLGLKKFFYYHSPGTGDFFLSNRLEAVSGLVETEVDPVSVAMSAMVHHYIDGRTFLKDIRYTSPASHVHYNVFKRELRFGNYWDCAELMNLEITETAPLDMAGEFKGILGDYLKHLSPSRISVTLTGGLDSRTILAALLDLGVQPHTFTYGHPQSPDAVTARNVAKAVDLKYHCHSVTPTAGWFTRMAEEIVDKGNGITHIHRAHRLQAVKMETQANPDTDMIIGGYMGGECIRNFYYDDLIVSPFVRRWVREPGDKRQLLAETMKNRFIRPEAVDMEHIYEILKNQRFLGGGAEALEDGSAGDTATREFFLTLLLLAGVHHPQDPNLFAHYVKYPVPIYLDIDFLYMIFSSQYNFLQGAGQEEKGGGNVLKRVKGAELYCYFVDAFSPELAAIPFAKRGYYSAREFVKNPTTLLVMKRAKRYWLNRGKGPVNFELGGWIEDFAKWQLRRMEGDDATPRIFDLNRAKQQLNNRPHLKKETYWRPFTDIIWNHMAVKKYM